MNDFIYGLKRGIPIALGYLAVSFAFGVFAITGLSPLAAIILSFTNVTSAGQFAGVKMIFETASFIEIAVTVFLINLRYSLMSISLSQKIDSNVPTWKRLIFGYGVTDEVFAVAISEKRKITPAYMYGLILLPILGWTIGTALGAIGANIIPDRLLDALGIALYAMFIAIVVPDAKKSKSITIVVLIAIALSCMFEYVPYINQIGVGFKVVISTIIAASIGAILFPVKEDEEHV